jgi:hypothetical protein
MLNQKCSQRLTELGLPHTSGMYHATDTEGNFFVTDNELRSWDEATPAHSIESVIRGAKVVFGEEELDRDTSAIPIIVKPGYRRRVTQLTDWILEGKDDNEISKLLLEILG